MHRLAEYFKELEGYECVISDTAFASYRIDGDSCYIKDIWVSKENRKSYAASELADKITKVAKEAGCTHLLGSVYINIKDPTTSTKVLLGYGFKISHLVQNGIIFKKEIV